MTIEHVPVKYRPTDPGVVFDARVQSQEPAADISRVMGIIRRQLPVSIIGAVAAVVLGLIFLWMAEPSYRSSIQILLDQENAKLLARISGDQQAPSSDEYVATQIGLISSDVVARRVIAQLGLVYDPDSDRLSLSPKAESTSSANPQSERMDQDEASLAEIDPYTVNKVLRSIAVYQVGKSLVIEISAAAPDPEVARQLADAYGQAYLADQLSARFDAIKKAGSWLEDRIDTLNKQSLQASAEVEKFRSDHSLVSSNGRLISDQQLGRLLEQLTTAKSAVSRAAAKIEVFEGAIASGDVNKVVGLVATSSDFTSTSPIKTISDEYLSVSGQFREVVATWGRNNEQAKALSAEMKRLSSSIDQEVKRVLESYRNEYKVAQAEERSIEAAMNSAAGQTQADMSTLVMLRNLEQKASSYNALYQEYLARYQQAVQQKTLSLTTGRIISQAEMPAVPVFPRKGLVLALALLLGAGFGACVGFGRELADRAFRSKADVEALGLPFLGYVGAGDWPKAGGTFHKQKLGLSITSFARNTTIWSSVLDSIRVALKMRGGSRSRVVGISSLHASCSKSSLALAYAEKQAQSGMRVLLIEHGSQQCWLSHALSSENDAVFTDINFGPGAPQQTLLRLESGALFLPAYQEAEMGDGVPFARILEAWRSTFDLIIVDLPPAQAISEARALMPYLDGYVCVVEWGKTQRDLLPALIHASTIFESKMIGVVMTEVDMGKLHLYDPQIARELKQRILN